MFGELQKKSCQLKQAEGIKIKKDQQPVETEGLSKWKKNISVNNFDDERKDEDSEFKERFYLFIFIT